MNSKTTIVLFLLFSIVSTAVAQPYEKIYFNKQGLKTNKRSAYTYRVILGEQEMNLQVEDYYMDGTLRMKGSYGTTNPLLVDGPSAVVLREGDFVYYYPDGKVEKRASCIKGQPDGIWVSYYDTDEEQIKELKHYRVGIPIRTWKAYYCNGNLKEEISYVNGKRDGLCIRYNEQGELMEKTIYDKGDKVRDLMEQADTTDTTDKKKFKYVEQMPEPKYNVNRYLAKNIYYPARAKERNISGRVIVYFLIDEEGYISEVYSKSPEVDYSLQMEAVRVVSEMPQWKPGLQNGKAVKVYYTLPISFRLQ